MDWLGYSVFFVVLLVTALERVRRLHFQWFLIGHWIGFVGIFVSMTLHGGNMVAFAAASLALDWVVRAWKLSGSHNCRLELGGR